MVELPPLTIGVVAAAGAEETPEVALTGTGTLVETELPAGAASDEADATGAVVVTAGAEVAAGAVDEPATGAVSLELSAAGTGDEEATIAEVEP